MTMGWKLAPYSLTPCLETTCWLQAVITHESKQMGTTTSPDIKKYENPGSHSTVAL